MPIDFSCPSCNRQYRVKDELAGKNAKCGKCGHRMPIPTHSTSTSATVANKSAGVSTVASAKSAAGKAAPKKSPPTKPVSVRAVQTAKKASGGASSWLDEELEASQSTIVKAPLGPRTPCPSCGQPLSAGAVLCVACGYDTRTQTKLETQHVGDSSAASTAKVERASRLGYAGSLMRGTFFSFLGAMLGATIWAVFTYLTMWQSGYIALLLGGLTGLGMALGHEDDDGTTAGIIAAFMSLFGIIAAKILIVVIFVAAMIGQLKDIAEDAADPIVWKRTVVASAIAEEKLAAQGVDPDEATEEQWEEATAAAEAEVASLDEKTLDERIAAIEAKEAAEEEALAADEIDEGDSNEADPAEPVEADEAIAAVEGEEEAPSFVGLFFEIMFDPIDGIFILLAFFTAYKVGSGEMTD